jgi:hypothetical protein
VIGVNYCLNGNPSRYLLPDACPKLQYRLNGLKVKQPVNSQGTLLSPNKSLAMPNGEQNDATSPHSPPELPPQDLLKFHGFLAYPKRLLFV